jgi:lysophospholipase L1-like esterase
MSSGTLRNVSRHIRTTVAAVALAWLTAAAIPSFVAAQSGETRWVGAWGTAPISLPAARASSNAEPANPAFPAPPQVSNQTVRQIVRTSVGGSQVRVALTNRFGTKPLRIGGGHVALRAEGSAIVERSGGALAFRGKPTVTIEPGSMALSDPVSIAVKPLSDVAIDLYLPDEGWGATSPTTYHSAALATSYLSAKGNHAGAAKLPVESTFQQWLFLQRVDVSSASSPGTIVTFGDSITDGTGSTPDTNNRWPDFLARRLVERYGSAAPGVINMGIAGNRVLNHNAGSSLLKRAGIPVVSDGPDDPNALFGPSGLSRFDQDALLQTGVTHVIVLETINDIGMAFDPVSPTVEQLISGHRALIQRAHARGLKIYGGTLTPFKGAFYWTESGEARRQKLNEWIRTSGEYDGAIDFDAAVRDPKDPVKFREDFQPGDWLHANDAGYKAMGAAIDLALFANGSAAGSGRKR